MREKRREDIESNERKRPEHSVTLAVTHSHSNSHNRYSKQADVYSFAICMWEIFTRLDAYKGKIELCSSCLAVLVCFRKNPFPSFPHPFSLLFSFSPLFFPLPSIFPSMFLKACTCLTLSTKWFRNPFALPLMKYDRRTSTSPCRGSL